MAAKVDNRIDNQYKDNCMHIPENIYIFFNYFSNVQLKNLSIILFLNLLFLLVFSLLPLSGQTDNKKPKSVKIENQDGSFALFESDRLLEAKMQLDLVSYMKKNLKGDSKDAVLTFLISETDSLTREISIDTRGKFRLGTCSFAPMQIKFKKSLDAYADSLKVKKIKLVTHCKPGTLYDEYVLREYLVYRMFNILTDTSYRVRLLRINYTDREEKRKPMTQYAFFIEPNSVLADRLNSTIWDSKSLTQKHIVSPVMDRVSIFNYMVSNWDWHVPDLQNITVLRSKTFSNMGLGLAIPYDFDLTGVVNANYAVVPEEFRMDNVRDRVFLGVCSTEAVFRKELQEFLAKKKDFYSLINEFPYLNERAKKDITDFLDQFFDQFENQRRLDNLVNNLLTTCKIIQ